MPLKKNMPLPNTAKKPKKATVPKPAPTKRRKRDGEKEKAEGQVQPEENTKAHRVLGPRFKVGQRVVYIRGMQVYKVVRIEKVAGSIDDYHVHARFGVAHIFDLQQRFTHAQEETRQGQAGR